MKTCLTTTATALIITSIMLVGTSVSFATSYSLDRSKCVVSADRAAHLEKEYLRFKKIATKICKLGSEEVKWLRNNWMNKSGTAEYERHKERRNQLKRALNWAKEAMHMIQAEYYGWKGGIAMPYDPDDLDGEKPTTPKSNKCPRCGGITLLGQCQCQ